MKAMKPTELRQSTVSELKDKERELSEELFALRLKKATGQLQNSAKIKSVRRDLARVMTVLGEKAG